MGLGAPGAVQKQLRLSQPQFCSSGKQSRGCAGIWGLGKLDQAPWQAGKIKEMLILQRPEEVKGGSVHTCNTQSCWRR